MPANHSAPPPVPSRPSAPPVRLLLVEDHADTLLVVAKLLTRHGYSVVTAPCVAEAMNVAAASDPFHVAVIDIGLPDGDGCDLMIALRQTHDLCGIALTGFGYSTDTERCRAAGFAEHIVKPFDIKVLTAAIDRLASQPGCP